MLLIFFLSVVVIMYLGCRSDGTANDCQRVIDRIDSNAL
jgi:hypothetical protein